MRLLSTEAPSLPRNYSASLVLRASPPPQTARPDSHEVPVDPRLRSPLGFPVLRLVPCVCMPSPLPGRTHGLVRSFSPMDFGFPRCCDGSAPALTFSRPAHRSLSLRPANSPSRLKRPSTPEASAASSPPLLLRLLPGGANQFPGGTFTRSQPAPFHGARENA